MGGTSLDKFKAFNERYKNETENFDNSENKYFQLLDRSIAPKTYYIDCVNGNDSNDGLSINSAFRTIAKAVSITPTFINHDYKIQLVSSGTYDACHIENKYGYLTISGNYSSPSSYTLTGGSIRWHNVKLNVYGISVLSTAPSFGYHSIWIRNATVFMEACNAYCRNGHVTLHVMDYSYLRVHNSSITGNYTGIVVENNSKLILDYTIGLSAGGGIVVQEFSSGIIQFFSGSSFYITGNNSWDYAVKSATNSNIWFRDSFQQSKFTGSASAKYYADQTSKITGNFEYLSVTATSNYTATLNKEKYINCNTISGAITVKMPTGADTDRTYIVTDMSGAASANPISISGSGKLINGSPTASITASYMSKVLTYSGSTWIMK